MQARQEQKILNEIRSLVRELPAITKEEMETKQTILALLVELESRLVLERWEVWT